MKQPEQELGVVFGVQKTPKSQQLVVTGPQDFMQSQYEEFKIGPRFPFRLQIDEAQQTATWQLNSLAIGRMKNNPTSRNESLTRANDFISRVVRGIASGEVIGDDRLTVQQYAPTKGGFDFAAEISKPELPPSATELAIEHNTGQLADCLKLERHERPWTLVHTSQASRAVSGFNMHMGDRSAVRTIDNYAESFEIAGRNVEDGYQPLVYLMGAVAVARADELANQ